MNSFEFRHRFLLARALVVMVITLMTGAALAGAVPIGGEFRINTFTTGNQTPAATQTSGVASDEAGNFVAVWASSEQDGSLEGIYAQRFAASGAPIGGEFRVNTTTHWKQTNPVVAMGPSGNFVVVWLDALKDGDGYGIYLQRFDSGGNPVGVETRVNDTTTSHQVDASVAINGSGDFVVCWASNAQDGSLYGVYAKRYNADGTQKGPEFRVSTHTLDNQNIANVALDDLGRFVITWSSRGQDGEGTGVYFQQYDGAGMPVGVETRANTVTALDQLYSTVGLGEDGNFTISWTSVAQDGDSDGIYARQFDWQGNAFGPEFRVNTQTAGRQYVGKLSMDESGAFIVTWRSVGQDGSDEGVYAQLFNADGMPNGDEFRVNTTTQNSQASESAAYVGNRLVLIWTSNVQDGSGLGVYGQRYLVCDAVSPQPVINTVPSSLCPFGNGSASVQTVYAQYSWSITNGTIQGANDLPSVAFTAGSSGSTHLTVTVADSAGCPASANATVNIFTPVTPMVSASGPTSFCEGGGVTLTASAGSSYAWSNGATTQSMTAIESGSYFVTVRDANGCSATSDATTVTVHPLPAGTISTSGPTTFCEGGSVTLTAPAGNSSYAWSNGATTQSITVTTTSYHNVTFTNANGCSSTVGVPVQVNPSPAATITASGPTTFCEGGKVTLTAGTSDAYSWSNGATTQSIIADASGSYTVTVTGSNGCSATSAPTVVTVNDAPDATITATGPTTFCEGAYVGLIAPAGAASYVWSNGETGQSITAIASGSYNVTVTGANGCSATSAPVTVTNSPRPDGTITASGPTTFCEGGSVTLIAAAGLTSYAWSNGATTQSITVNSSGNYNVNVTDANGCTAWSAGTVVTVNSLPAQPVVAANGPTTFCEGGNVTLTAPASHAYSWSNGATTQSITVNATGNYSVTVANANGCSATSAITTVTVNPLPVATITANGPTTFCAGGSVTLTAGSAASYLWSNGATTQSITTSASGAYSVTVTNASGCSTTSAPVSVTAQPEVAGWLSVSETACIGSERPASAQAIVGGAYVDATYAWSISGGTITQNSGKNIMFRAESDPLLLTVVINDANGCSVTKSKSVFATSQPEPVITTSGPTTFCEGGYVTLTANEGSPFGSYLWSTGATTQSILVTESGSYSVTASGNECSATSKSVVVTVLPAPEVTVTASGPTNFCEGGSVTLTASGGSTYLWSNGATTQSITVTAAGEYSVIGTNANGCSNNIGILVTTYPAPAATITPSGPTTFCDGGSVTLTAPSGSSYAWSNGATTQSINVTSSGSYSVTVTNASGCSATSSATTVTVNAAPAAVISSSGPTTFCVGGSVTLTASAGTSYLWSTGATTQSINATSSGSYSVTVTNASSCSTTSSPTTVTVNAAPAATITALGPTTFCAGGSVTLTASAGTSYVWSTGATTQSINATSSGSYSVTVTDASGCSSTSSPTTVTVNAAPAVTISASGPTTFCTGGSVTLTAGAGASYLWSNGATTQSINATSGGSYSVTVTNASGCSAASAPTSVVVNAKPSTPAVTASGPTTFCAGGSVTLTAPAGYSYSWSTGATSQSIVVSTTGSYTVTVANASGCSSTSAAMSVAVNAASSITQQPQTQTIPKNTTTQLSVTAAGTGTLTYQWYRGTSPSTATPISGATASTYTTPKLARGAYAYWVRVTSSCGVVNSATATITAQ